MASCVLRKFIVSSSKDNFFASSSPQAALKTVECSLHFYLFIFIFKKLWLNLENGKLLPWKFLPSSARPPFANSKVKFDMTKLLLSRTPLRSSKYMRKRRILIGLSLLKPISTIGDKNNLSRGGRGETRTGTFFTGGYGRHGSEGVKRPFCHLLNLWHRTTYYESFIQFAWLDFC